MEELINQVKALKKDPIISKRVKARMAEFDEFKNKQREDWFSELCFCLTTANSSQKKGAEIQQALGFNGYYNLSLEELTKNLKTLGHRFYNVRSKFIHEARKHVEIKKILSEFETDHDKRMWLVENVKGLGMKEASHFLRNTGHKNVAILDRHILRAMADHNMIDQKKTITKNFYLEGEKALQKICDATNLSQGALDLYIWYTKTGEILK